MPDSTESRKPGNWLRPGDCGLSDSADQRSRSETLKFKVIGPKKATKKRGRGPPPAPPSYHELRDGLMWRWIDCPG